MTLTAQHSLTFLVFGMNKGAFTYDVSSRGGGGFEMLTVADKGGGGGGGGLSLADVSKNTSILAKIFSNQACLSLCVRLLY